MRVKKNPKKDWRGSREKWADTTKSISLQLHEAVDMMQAGAIIRKEGNGAPMLGKGKYFVAVPKEVFSDLKRFGLITVTERRRPLGRLYVVYGCALPLGAYNAAVETSRETAKHRKTRTGVSGKTMGKQPFET